MFAPSIRFFFFGLILAFGENAFGQLILGDADLEMENYDHAFQYLNAGVESNLSLGAEYIPIVNGTLELCVDSSDTRAWTSLGPFTSQYSSEQNQGRVECISPHPTRPNELLVGGANGGIWKSTDGGAHWINQTDDELFSLVGINALVRHPDNPDLIYAATGNYLNRWNRNGRSYGLGVIYSEDGGSSWKLSSFQIAYGSWRSACLSLAIDPRSTLDSTILYLGTMDRLYAYGGYSIPNQKKWAEIDRDRTYYRGPYHWGAAEYMDVEVDRNGHVWFANINGVFKYNPITQDLNNIKSSWTYPDFIKQGLLYKDEVYQNPVKGYYDIEINAIGEIVVLANFTYLRNYGRKTKFVNKPYTIAKSSDGGNSWTPFSKCASSGYRYPNLAVHPYHSNVVYFETGGRRMAKSVDFGRTIKAVKNGRNHVDVRCLVFDRGSYGDTLGVKDRVYVGTDGGISILTNDSAWQDISGYGLTNTNYFGVTVDDENINFMLAGAQDGSQNFLLDSIWLTTNPGGDNGECLILNNAEKTVFQSSNGSLYRGKMLGQRFKGRYVLKLFDNFGLFPLTASPTDTNVVFAGGEQLWWSEDQGLQWKKIDFNAHDVPTMVQEIVASNQQAKRVFFTSGNAYWRKKSSASAKENRGGIYKAEYLNDAWEIVDLTSNLRSKCSDDGSCGLPGKPISLSINPTNENQIFVCFDGVEKGQKVFMTVDGGASWQNISACLPNIPMSEILYDPMHDNLYVGSDLGLFVLKNLEGDWSFVGRGGPNCMISDMELHQKTNALIVATLGRGIWKLPLTY